MVADYHRLAGSRHKFSFLSLVAAMLVLCCWNSNERPFLGISLKHHMQSSEHHHHQPRRTIATLRYSFGHRRVSIDFVGLCGVHLVSPSQHIISSQLLLCSQRGSQSHTDYDDCLDDGVAGGGGGRIILV